MYIATGALLQGLEDVIAVSPLQCHKHSRMGVSTVVLVILIQIWLSRVKGSASFYVETKCVSQANSVMTEMKQMAMDVVLLVQ